MAGASKEMLLKSGFTERPGRDYIFDKEIHPRGFVTQRVTADSITGQIITTISFETVDMQHAESLGNLLYETARLNIHYTRR